jgi:hypothetical protein
MTVETSSTTERRQANAARYAPGTSLTLVSDHWLCKSGIE